MKICTFYEVEQEIISHLRARRLIPVIGSGFSVGSSSFKGKVPSGKEMKADMIYEILQLNLPNLSKETLDGKHFSQISSYYQRLVPQSVQRDYIRNRFTKVALSEVRRKFLEIDWLYIYTINVDDAIEHCSEYSHVLISNRIIDFSVLEDSKCVLKLHGDCCSMLSYHDDCSQIFDYKSYAKSIETNKSLLTKLKHDFTYNNLLFVGCSLDNEFDIATIDNYQNKDIAQNSSKYFFSVEEPDILKQIELEQYGITHIVKFDDFDSMYELMTCASENSHQIPLSEIYHYKSLSIRQLGISYPENSAYLFHGKALLGKAGGEICIPNFFIDRKISDTILREIRNYPIHILYGNHVSGKSYMLISVLRKTKDRDVYFFDSKNSVNDETLNKLTFESGALLIFDTNSITKNQIFFLMRNSEIIKKRNISVIVAVNKSDKDVVSTINQTSGNKLIKGHYVEPYFDPDDIKLINPILAVNELPNFIHNMTLMDNLISIEKSFQVKGILTRVEPNLKTVDDVMVLILLAVKEKLYTQELTKYNIDLAGFSQIRKSKPLISDEHVLYFEQDISNSSQQKIVVYAKYWLYETLGNFATRKQNYPIIVEAFQRIISITLTENSKSYYNNVIDFIKFDIINEIFPSRSKGQLGLGSAIYEGLHMYLSKDEKCFPHYYHQRAKCYLWQSGYSESDLPQLDEALKYAQLAKRKLDTEYSKTKNQKLKISLAHIEFTICLIWARKNIILKHLDVNVRTHAIHFIFEALQNPYNYNEFTEHSKNRKRNGDDIVDIRQTVENADTRLLDTESLKELQHIITFLTRN